MTSQFGVKVRRHPDYPNLHLFAYDQIESPKGHPVVIASRGTILDADADWRVVCRPFDRFFNHGEGYAQPVDWGSARVYVKEDGSLLNMFWYDGAWRVATKGSPGAAGQVGDNPFTFSDLFWAVFNGMYGTLPDPVYRDMTFMFELCSKYNRVVVRHPEDRLALLGVRKNSTGEEFDPHIWQGKYEAVAYYNLSSVDDIQRTFEDMDPLAQEGYVVCDGNFRRIKVKHPDYVAIHHLKESTSKKRFLDIARTGEQSEFLAHFPEYREEYAEVEGRYLALVSHLEEVWSQVAHYPADQQKEFALALKSKKCRASGTLFQLRKAQQRGDTSVTIRRILAVSSMGGLLKVLGYKD